MTTTSLFQNLPDYYSSKEECSEEKFKTKIQTNPRYSNFTHTIFHAGDEEQFQKYRDEENGNVCLKEINIEHNLFKEIKISDWIGYKDLEANAVLNTFKYIFNKFKKGIFVKIIDNKLKVFLPFSKVNFQNEWGDRLKIDPKKYGSINDFLRHVSDMEGRRFSEKNINSNTFGWYANNCLLRYEFPLSERDTNVNNVKNMLEELCASREVPDIEFFINRRDFPLLTKDSTEPYNNIWDSLTQKLVSHNYEKFCPILSMSVTDRYADIPIPTHDDWGRIQSFENKWFIDSCKSYSKSFDFPWENKKPTAVFRGGTTGCGVTIDTNPRLKVSYLSLITKPDKNGIPYLDAGMTNWNLRPRKIQGNKYLQTIEIKSLPFGLVSKLTPEEQSEYKYIINIDGHVSAFRLSLELNMGSVILMVNSSWKIWYSSLLKPYEHYVPIKEDLSDLIEKIKWCRKHDEECKQIVKNAKDFYNKYLLKNGVMDYLQKTLYDLKKQMGIYLYNVTSPLNLQIHEEMQSLSLYYPHTEKNINDISYIPQMSRSYGLLQGIQWVINMINSKGNFEEVAQFKRNIFSNKLGDIRQFNLANFSLAVKTTSDSQKMKEHIHETFVGTKCINKVIKSIPNFVYVFGMYFKNDTLNVITEYIQGQTLFEYIKSSEFSMADFLLILIQICLAIQVAQNLCGFVHWDLTPWNIMIQKIPEPIIFSYIIKYDKIYNVKTNIIPIIIDYGKSHVIYEDIHHGFINPYKVSTIQDILTILLTSINQIGSDQHLSSTDFAILKELANFISGTTYRKDNFQNSKDLKNFMNIASKYSDLISSNKYELETKSPMDLIFYIYKKTKFKFPFGLAKSYKNMMNLGNTRQVFEFILSNNIEDRIKSYSNVFNKLIKCALPQPNNLFFIYFVAQSLEENIISVKDNMLSFLKSEKINLEIYEKQFIKVLIFLKNFYIKKISEKEKENISFTLNPSEYSSINLEQYDENTFLLPNKIFEFVKQEDLEDLSEYKEIIELILTNESKVYKLSEDIKKYYITNFEKLLHTPSINMKTNTANIKTVKKIAKEIYSKNIEVLLPKINDKNDCSDAISYLKIYEKIVSVL